LLPLLLFACIVATGASGCAGGDSTTAPTAQLEPSEQPKQPTPPVPPTNGLGLALTTAISTPTVDQPATFYVGASSSADGRIDFGDGDQESFELEASVARAVTHVYRRTGTFVATFTATTAAGASSSVVITLVVR
jgi:hypothetical protein